MQWLAIAITKVITWLGNLAGWSVDPVLAYFSAVLQPTRSVLLIVACYCFAISTDQGHVIATSILPGDGTQSGEIWRWFITISAVVWFAVQAWWWARVLLNHRIHNQTKRNLSDKQIRVLWTPRFYALAIYLATAYSLWTSNNETGCYITIALGAINMAFLIRRRAVMNGAPSTKLMKTFAQTPVVPDKDTGKGAFKIYTEPGKTMLALSFLVALTMVLLVAIAPVATGMALGSLAIALLGFASIIPVLGSVSVNDTASRSPFIVALLLWAVVISLIPALDHHRIRELRERAPESENIKALYADWEAKNHNEPMVLISTAGGGIRAAYWTGAILGLFEDCIPDFHKHVFSISGVSGGSVGAAFWETAVKDASKKPKSRIPSCPADMGPDDFRKTLQVALSRDYLAPTVGTLLYQDLLHAFAPFPWPDRAAVLEKSWEEGYRQAFGTDSLSNSFLDLWQGVQADDWMPILLFNGTHQETGRRVITSNLQIDDRTFPDALDFFHLFQSNIRTSTAALNSARFTYVSPAGAIQSSLTKSPSGHIIDGGYFENYGARTTRDIEVALSRIDNRWNKKREVIIVEIVNDVDLLPSEIGRQSPDPQHPVLSDVQPNKNGDDFGIINEIVAPFQGLMQTRGARGNLEAKLSVRNNETDTDFISPKDAPIDEPKDGRRVTAVQFRLCKELDPPPPLGWVLGKANAEAIDNELNTAMEHAINHSSKENEETCNGQVGNQIKQLEDTTKVVH